MDIIVVLQTPGGDDVYGILKNNNKKKQCMLYFEQTIGRDNVYRCFCFFWFFVFVVVMVDIMVVTPATGGHNFLDIKNMFRVKISSL